MQGIKNRDDVATELLNTHCCAKPKLTIHECGNMDAAPVGGLWVECEACGYESAPLYFRQRR